MGHIDETRLPGIGTRVEFVTDDGRRVGVVQHHGGRRELFVCWPDDPDSTQWAVKLTEDDARSLVDALGVVSVAEDAGQRSYEVEGLVFEWIDLHPDSPAVGRTIGEQRIRTVTGASIVAVLRESGPVPAPEPTFVLAAGDTLVAAGTADGIAAARTLLQTS